MCRRRMERLQGVDSAASDGHVLTARTSYCANTRRTTLSNSVSEFSVSLHRPKPV